MNLDAAQHGPKEDFAALSKKADRNERGREHIRCSGQVDLGPCSGIFCSVLSPTQTSRLPSYQPDIMFGNSLKDKAQAMISGVKKKVVSVPRSFDFDALTSIRSRTQRHKSRTLCRTLPRRLKEHWKTSPRRRQVPCTPRIPIDLTRMSSQKQRHRLRTACRQPPRRSPADP